MCGVCGCVCGHGLSGFKTKERMEEHSLYNFCKIKTFIHKNHKIF